MESGKTPPSKTWVYVYREGVPELWGNPLWPVLLPLAHSRFKEEDVPGADMSRQGLWEPLSQNFKAKRLSSLWGPQQVIMSPTQCFGGFLCLEKSKACHSG